MLRGLLEHTKAVRAAVETQSLDGFGGVHINLPLLLFGLCKVRMRLSHLRQSNFDDLGILESAHSVDRVHSCIV